MKDKNWFTNRIESDDEHLAHRCFNITITPMLTKFVTTTTIVPNTDVKYVDYDDDTEKMKANINKLSKKVLNLEDKVKRLDDSVSFHTILGQ